MHSFVKEGKPVDHFSFDYQDTKLGEVLAHKE